MKWKIGDGVKYVHVKTRFRTRGFISAQNSSTSSFYPNSIVSKWLLQTKKTKRKIPKLSSQTKPLANIQTNVRLSYPGRAMPSVRSMTSPFRPLRILRSKPTIAALAATMSTSASERSDGPWTVKNYTPRHDHWPYSERDFQRRDEAPDTVFYSTARMAC